ncbi:MAG: DUF5715 family protein [Pseudomonadota bacterium]
MQKLTIAILALASFAPLLTFTSAAEAQTLKGSRESMARQNQEAVRYGYTFLRNAQSVTSYVKEGHLIRISPDQDLDLHDVSYPYARPAVKTFIDRLSNQYHVSCGEKLTVTSLTRPIDKQPSNASSESVHPTGMAVDLRIPSAGKCRNWLEKTLLSLESSGVLDVTRERHPAHYHVAVFTQTYEQYVAGLNTESTQQPLAAPTEYVVRRGDTLSVIADRTGSTVTKLRAANGLRGSLIHAGQKLQIPGAVNSAPTTAMVATTAPAFTQTVAATVATGGSTPTSTSASGETNAASMTSLASTNARTTDTAAIQEITHRVKRGDTLWRIANHYGTSARVLQRQNGLSDDVLQVGQVLRVGVSNGSH